MRVARTHPILLAIAGVLARQRHKPLARPLLGCFVDHSNHLSKGPRSGPDPFLDDFEGDRSRVEWTKPGNWEPIRGGEASGSA